MPSERYLQFLTALRGALLAVAVVTTVTGTVLLYLGPNPAHVVTTLAAITVGLVGLTVALSFEELVPR